MARTELTIHLVPGTPRTGIWCDTCLTSARYEVDVLVLGDDGLYPISVIRRCNRCDDDDG